MRVWAVQKSSRLHCTVPTRDLTTQARHHLWCWVKKWLSMSWQGCVTRVCQDKKKKLRLITNHGVRGSFTLNISATYQHRDKQFPQLRKHC